MSEERLQIAVCKYIKYQYPDVIFTFDASGIRMSMGMAKKAAAMRSGRGLPDLNIYHPAKGYHGLMIELKKESIYKKDGTLKAGEHLQEQAAMHKRLRDLGYIVDFACSFEEAVKMIDEYLS